jgi:exopolysaccharide biosynthesis polyprenyl glycosylphosphotransferase
MPNYLRNLFIDRVALAVALDALCLIGAATLTWYAIAPPIDGIHYAIATAVCTVLSLVGLFYCDAYQLMVLGSGRRTFACVVGMMGLAFGAALVTYFAVSLPKGTTEVLAHVAGLYFCLLLAARLLYRALLSIPRLGRRVLVIGTSDLGRAIARSLDERAHLGVEMVGFLSDDIDDQGGEVAGFPVLGKVHEIEKIIDPARIRCIVVASKSRTEHFPKESLLAAKLRGCRVESGVTFYERVTGRIYLRDLRESYLIFSDGFRMGPAAAAAKRSLDVVSSAIGLILVAPVLAVAAAAIKLDTRGPVFYRQERVGQNNRHFLVLKLRSMRVDAEALTGAVWASDVDPRITRVGRWLRKTRLDEIPQLWNVLIGEMSLVGPRPERPEFVETLSERYPYFRSRSALKPGVTGWAQIRHGYVNEIEGFEEKLALDFYYMKYRSLAMDLLILWKTAKTVVLFHGV